MPRRVSQVSTERILTLVDAGVLDRCVTLSSSISVVRRDEHLAGVRVDDVLERDAAEDAVAERLDDLAALDERRHLDAVEVPQSYSVMIASCATSTRRRVR